MKPIVEGLYVSKWNVFFVIVILINEEHLVYILIHEYMACAEWDAWISKQRGWG
jgi:hypothetical protein